MLCNVHARPCSILLYLTALIAKQLGTSEMPIITVTHSIRGFGLTGLYLNQPLQTPGLWYYKIKLDYQDW